MKTLKKSKNESVIVYRVEADATRLTLLLFGIVALAAVSGFFAEDETLGEKFHIVLGLSAALLGGCSVLVLYAVFLRRQYLQFSRKGLSVTAPLSRRRWRWSDIGPFSVSVWNLPSMGFPNHSQIYLCAFKDRNHDLIETGQMNVEPTPQTADVVIALSPTYFGKNTKRAEKLARHLNLWRDRFGKPETDIDDSSAMLDREQLLSRIRRKGIIYAVSIFVVGILWWLSRVYLNP